MTSAAPNGDKQATEFSSKSIGVLFASIVGMTVGPTGLLATSYTLLIQPLSGQFAWNRTDASLPITLLGLTIALSSPLKGLLVDRFGPRALVLPATVLLGLCTATLALAQNTAQLYGLFSVIGLLAPGNVPFGRIVGEWFHRQRGMAYGLLGFGFTLGSVGGLQLARPLIDGLGWRTAFAIYGGLHLFITLPVAYFWFRDSPVAPVGDTAASPKFAPVGITPTDAWRSRNFWLIVGNLTLSVFAVAGVLTQGVPILVEQGFSRTTATTILSGFLIGTTLSQPLLGHLMDRFDTPRVAIPFALAAVIGIAVFPLMSGPILAFTAIMTAGVGGGGESGTTQYFVARYFGLRHFSLIYGSIQPFTMIVAVGLGQYVLGTLYDRTGSYRLDLTVMSAALLLATLLLLFLQGYRYPAAVNQPPITIAQDVGIPFKPAA